MTTPALDELTDRQRRELEYHRGHAAKLRDSMTRRVPLGAVRDTRRRWWNAYWSAYTLIRQLDLAGKRALVPGCGIGDDAVMIASTGALVSAFDLSPDIIDIARHRAALHDGIQVEYATMAAEKLDYPDDTFDLVFFVDILHHVDIAATMREVRRVAKPGARVIGDELYTHSALQRIRTSRVVTNTLHPLMEHYIYRGDAYITEDEHKIDEDELAIVRETFADRWTEQYFGVLQGRILPITDWNLPSQLDRLTLMALGRLGRFLAARIVFTGLVVK